MLLEKCEALGRYTQCSCCSTPLGSRTYYVTFISSRLSCRPDASGESSSEPQDIVAPRCESCWFMQMMSAERSAPVTVTYRITR